MKVLCTCHGALCLSVAVGWCNQESRGVTGWRGILSISCCSVAQTRLQCWLQLRTSCAACHLVTAQHSTALFVCVLDGGLCYTCSRDASVSALPVTNGRWCCGQRIFNACSWLKPCLPLAAPACLHALLLVCRAWWCLYHRCRGSVASFRLWGPLLDLTTAYCLARALATWCFCFEPTPLLQ